MKKRKMERIIEGDSSDNERIIESQSGDIVSILNSSILTTSTPISTFNLASTSIPQTPFQQSEEIERIMMRKSKSGEWKNDLFDMKIVFSAKKSISSLPDPDQISKISKLDHELTMKSNELSRALIEKNQLQSKIETLVMSHAKQIESLKFDQKLLYDQSKLDKEESKKAIDEKNKFERMMKTLQTHIKFLEQRQAIDSSSPSTILKRMEKSKQEEMENEKDLESANKSLLNMQNNENSKIPLNEKLKEENMENERILYKNTISNLEADCSRYRKTISELENDFCKTVLELQKLRSESFRISTLPTTPLNQNHSHLYSHSHSHSKSPLPSPSTPMTTISSNPPSPSTITTLSPVQIRRLFLENKQLKENRVNIAILQEQIYNLQTRLKVIPDQNEKIAILQSENDQLKREISQQQSDLNADLMRDNLEKTIQLAKLKEEYGNLLNSSSVVIDE